MHIYAHICIASECPSPWIQQRESDALKELRIDSQPLIKAMPTRMQLCMDNFYIIEHGQNKMWRTPPGIWPK